MKVKLLVSRAGPAGVQNAGDEIDVSGDEATRLIEAQQAVPVRHSAPTEKAVRRGRPPKAAD